MIKVDIKHRFDGRVLYSGEVPDGIVNPLRVVLLQAIAARAYLAGADLAGANLAGADLAGANLAGANLAGAIAVPSSTEKADPPEPYVRATTPEQQRARAAARAERYRKRNPEVPVVEQLDAKILAVIEAKPESFEMGQWHSACGTSHCRAGWAITLAGEQGKKLEEEHGPHLAGRMIYLASTGRSPHFFATNERALEDIRACAAEQPEATK
jgi:hypothetical protein